jgi:demethylmenaquinone methyltransferase / 2-methoxy-6-polyprenyl-1,4-benzoquinol methylase
MSADKPLYNSAYPLRDYYSRIFKKYDLVNHLFTWGMDKRWRRETSARCLAENPGKIIDLCCGTGDLTLELRKQAGGRVAITGYDFSKEMLCLARKKSEQANFTDILYIQGDAADMPFTDGEFDALTIGFGFRNLIYQNKNSAKHLSEINRVLRRYANLYILESAVPSSLFIRFFYNLYLNIILIPLGGVISGDWKAYRYLARSSSGYYSLAGLREILLKSGFEVKQHKTFLMGAANLVAAVKK